MSKPSFLGRMILRTLGVKSGALGEMSLEEYVKRLSQGAESATGISVDWQTALKITTAARCAQVLADGIATVPCQIMRRQGEDAVPEPNHPLNRVLGVMANQWQTGLHYRETIGYHIALSPGHFAVKVKNGKGQVIELLPVMPGAVAMEKPARFGEPPRFRVGLPVGGRVVEMGLDDLWHVPGASWNSYIGLDPVELGREAFGLAAATEKHHANLHRNGARPGGVYSVDGTLDADEHAALQAYLEKNVGGVDNSYKTLVLDRAAKFTSTTMTGVDSEHLATRRHQIEEVCRVMGVLPILVGHANEQTTFASSEQMFLAHAVHTVRPLHRRIEASINAGLLTKEDRTAGLFARFDDSELLRTNLEAQARYFASALGAGGGKGWMTQNEVRRHVGLPSKTGGDELPEAAAEVRANTPPGAPQ